MRQRRQRVLRLAADAGGGGVLLGAGTHRHLIDRTEQSVEHHRLDDRSVAHAKTTARSREEVRRVGHGFHATGDDDVGLTGLDVEVGEVDRVETGQAHLVDGGRGHRHRDAGLGRGLASGHLTGTAQQHLTHEHVVDLLGGQSGALERSADGDGSEIGGLESGEGAGELADGSAGAGEDDRSSHV